ncbi:ArsR family transcriptional regulator [Amycolatopsis sp. AA4]|uniref:ArsR/SmtB family transcription factor n=1 Tax=Actinomycetes TaxID=1760 RepID=UPI0001B56001|nr:MULTISPECIES: winged helix-turn-helix domain-containing protein [Actinomycetes]ATY11203.1 ArsR family transcriptional regulator [Amycolatopsis sp. AA4]
MDDRLPRQATADDLRALAHPLSWRILRLCLDSAWTNQQLAKRLEESPATVLRRVHALAEAGFLVAEPARRSDLGAWERPYRTTRRTWHLDLDQAGDPALTARVELATLDAHRAEMLEADPASIQQTRRGVVRLSDEAAAELQSRLDALLDEFVAREEPAGRRHSFLWSVVERPGEPDTAED